MIRVMANFLLSLLIIFSAIEVILNLEKDYLNKFRRVFNLKKISFRLKRTQNLIENYNYLKTYLNI
jgi:hypothetical protein